MTVYTSFLTVFNIEALVIPEVPSQVQVQLEGVVQTPLWVVWLLHLWGAHTDNSG